MVLDKCSENTFIRTIVDKRIFKMAITVPEQTASDYSIANEIIVLIIEILPKENHKMELLTKLLAI